MTATKHHKNFSEEEDIALLRHVLADLPFMKPRGSVMAAWDAVASTLVRDANFPRNTLSGKTASGRFDKFVEAHRAAVAMSAAASGVAEDVPEKTVLLNELLTLLDDHVASTASAKEAGQRLRERDEEASLAARQFAMETLRESVEDAAPVKKRKETELKELLVVLKEKELAEEKEAREFEAAQRARERQENREEAALIRREANEHMLSLVTTISETVLTILQSNRNVEQEVPWSENLGVRKAIRGGAVISSLKGSATE